MLLALYLLNVFVLMSCAAFYAYLLQGCLAQYGNADSICGVHRFGGCSCLAESMLLVVLCSFLEVHISQLAHSNVGVGECTAYPTDPE